jgi:hypothetical protein
MIKRLAIVFAVIGSVLLFVPMVCLYPVANFSEFMMTILLVALLATYSATDIRKMKTNEQKTDAKAFVIILLSIAFVFYLVAFELLNLFGPRYM